MTLQTNSCPCCGNSLLRHVRSGGIYWFCTSCWQEVPLLTAGHLSKIDSAAARVQPHKTIK